MTIRARFRFTVKAYANGTPWIAFEPLTAQFSAQELPTGIFGFDLPNGTSSEKAESIAEFLTENIDQFTFTKMPLV